MQPVAPLPRPLTAGIVAALLACAAAAWLITVNQAGSMGMGGIAMIAMTGAALFLITWLVMMVAMMFPSVAPMTLAFASVTRSRGEGILPTATFVLGYLLVWTAAGLVPLAVLQAGASHGLYCLGCCWALMAVLAVLGLMNIAWMAVFAAVFFIEKNVRRAELLPRVVGAACIAGGLAIVAWPVLLGAIPT